jgi:hypothetical protein
MSFQEQSMPAKKNRANPPDRLREVSLIGLAANLDDPLYYRTIGKLSIILEELKSINATVTQQRRGSQASRRYIE